MKIPSGRALGQRAFRQCQAPAQVATRAFWRITKFVPELSDRALVALAVAAAKFEWFDKRLLRRLFARKGTPQPWEKRSQQNTHFLKLHLRPQVAHCSATGDRVAAAPPCSSTLGRVKSIPDPNTREKVSRYTSHCYRDTFAKVCPPLGRK